MKSSRKKILGPISQAYKPEFEVPENLVRGISDYKIGQRVSMIVNFEVIEKTKHYTIIRVKGLALTKTKRTF